MYPIVLHEYGIIVLWSAKSACSSIKKTLLTVLKIDVDDVDDIHDFFGYADTEYSDIDLESPYDEYKVIMVIRNPYDRILSGYVDKYMKHSDIYVLPEGVNNFDDFVEHLHKFPKDIDQHHFCPQTSEFGWEWLQKSGRKPDYIFSLGEIGGFYDLIESIVGNKVRRYKANSSRKKSIKYKKKTRDLTSKIYKNDLKYFSDLGYNFQDNNLCGVNSSKHAARISGL